jgi:hypothetical protein
VTTKTAYDKSFLLLLFLIITKNTNELFAILEKQISKKNLCILFLFCGGPVASLQIRPWIC